MRKTLSILLLIMAGGSTIADSRYSAYKVDETKVFICYLKKKYPPNEWQWVESYRQKMQSGFYD